MRFKLVEGIDNKLIDVYTYQSDEVIDSLKNNQEYHADINSGMFQEKGSRNNPYRKLKQILGLSNYPIFGALSKTDLERMLDSSFISRRGRKLLRLRVPRNEIKITEYYDWTDYLYALEDRKSFEEESGITIKELEDLLREQRDVESYEEPQVILDRIEPSWVIED